MTVRKYTAPTRIAMFAHRKRGRIYLGNAGLDRLPDGQYNYDEAKERIIQSGWYDFIGYLFENQERPYAGCAFEITSIEKVIEGIQPHLIYSIDWAVPDGRTYEQIALSFENICDARLFASVMDEASIIREIVETFA